MSCVHQVWPKPSCKAQWKGKKTRQTEEEVGRQCQGMDKPGVQQVPEGNGEQGKWRKLVVKSSVVPQQPSRLRDRWWWWWWVKGALGLVPNFLITWKMSVSVSVSIKLFYMPAWNGSCDFRKHCNINVMSVWLNILLVFIELHFTLLAVILITFQGHISIKQLWKIMVVYFV